MPREFLPAGRKREPNRKAELFPRTSTRVMMGPVRDRMIHPEETETRRKAKRVLNGLRDAWGELAHVRD
jgi:hypothetical protein